MWGVMVETTMKNLENLEIWLIFWKVRKNLENSGRKSKKFCKSWRIREAFLIKLINLFLGCFFWRLSLKCVFYVFLHDRLLFIFDLFFHILIIGVLIVNCVLYLVFLQNKAVFRAALHIDVALAQFFVFCVTLVFCISRVDMKFIAGIKSFCLQMRVSWMYSKFCFSFLWFRPLRYSQQLRYCTLSLMLILPWMWNSMWRSFEFVV